jgi:hypothetical protein
MLDDPVYTEKQIREAWRHAWAGKGWTFPVSAVDDLVSQLRHVHDFADTDTVTAREVREAFRRILPNDCCQRCGSGFHGKDRPAEFFLKDISRHR